LKKTELIPLLNFESFIEDKRLLIAEKLFDEGGIIKVSSQSKGKWTGIVKDGLQYNVKASVHDGKVQQSSCNCDASSSEGSLCIHQITFFYALRHQDNLSPKTESAQISLKSRTRSSEYLKMIFENVPTTELNKFIQSYSNADKQFRLLLSTHFSRKIQDHFGTGIYERILDECFPAKTENSHRSYAAEIRLLIKIGKEMLINYRDALSLEAYTEAFHLIQSLNDKIAYALFINQKESKALRVLQEKVHDAYRLLINDRMAPGLKDEIVGKMISSVAKSFYQYKGPNNLFELILMAHPTKEQFAEFQQNIEEKLSNKLSYNDSSFLMAHMIYCLLQNDTREVDHSKFIQLFRSDPYLLIETLGKMFNLGMIKELNRALDFYKSADQIDQKSYLSFKLKLYIATNDTAKGIEAAFSLFELTLDPLYIRPIKTLSADQWPRKYASILKTLKNSKLPIWYDIALDLTQNEMDNDSLFELLSMKNDVDYFMDYDQSLVDTHADALYHYYRGYTLDYLKQHAGTKAAQKVLNVLHHLHTIGLSRVAKKLEKEITATYPERKTLQSLL
jgi:5-carboxymethyl-2-hydroxymuconate isomerase